MHLNQIRDRYLERAFVFFLPSQRRQGRAQCKCDMLGADPSSPIVFTSKNPTLLSSIFIAKAFHKLFSLLFTCEKLTRPIRSDNPADTKMSSIGSPRGSDHALLHTEQVSFLHAAKGHKRSKLRAIAIVSVAVGLVMNFTTLMVALTARNSRDPALITGIAFIPVRNLVIRIHSRY